MLNVHKTLEENALPMDCFLENWDCTENKCQRQASYWGVGSYSNLCLNSELCNQLLVTLSQSGVAKCGSTNQPNVMLFQKPFASNIPSLDNQIFHTVTKAMPPKRTFHGSGSMHLSLVSESDVTCVASFDGCPVSSIGAEELSSWMLIRIRQGFANHPPLC